MRPTEPSSKNTSLDSDQVNANPSDVLEVTPNDQIQHDISTAVEKRASVHNRIRMPVTYDDDLLGGEDFKDKSALLEWNEAVAAVLEQLPSLLQHSFKSFVMRNGRFLLIGFTANPSPTVYKILWLLKKLMFLSKEMQFHDIICKLRVHWRFCPPRASTSNPGFTNRPRYTSLDSLVGLQDCVNNQESEFLKFPSYLNVTIYIAIYLLCRNKHITVQSSLFELGNLCFHEAVAASTTAFAAPSSLPAAATIDTTSSLLSTSHTCSNPPSQKRLETETTPDTHGSIGTEYYTTLTPSVASTRNVSSGARRW